MKNHQPARVVLACVPWVMAAGAFSACSGSDDGAFVVQYRDRPAPILHIDASMPSNGGGEFPGIGGQPGAAGAAGFAGGPIVQPPLGGCDPQFCPAMGNFAGCCTLANVCGVDFGMGCVTGGRDGGGGPPPANTPVTCKSDGDCANGETCCGAMQGGNFTGVACQASCANGDVPVHCGAPTDCQNGQVCCGTVTQNVYEGIDCADACPAPQNGSGGYILCTSDTECSGGDTCQGSLLLPAGFTVCRQ